jgi:hypothetical protein
MGIVFFFLNTLSRDSHFRGKLKTGQNKFNPECYLVFRFSFALGSGHFNLRKGGNLMVNSKLHEIPAFAGIKP